VWIKRPDRVHARAPARITYVNRLAWRAQRDIARQSTRPLRAGALAGRRSIRKEREPPERSRRRLFVGGIEGGGDDQRLTGKSMVAPNASWPTIDLPRRLERLEDRTAFGDPARRRASPT
jgi:hypothetical protein